MSVLIKLRALLHLCSCHDNDHVGGNDQERPKHLLLPTRIVIAYDAAEALECPGGDDGIGAGDRHTTRRRRQGGRTLASSRTEVTRAGAVAEHVEVRVVNVEGALDKGSTDKRGIRRGLEQVRHDVGPVARLTVCLVMGFLEIRVWC